MDDDIDIEEHDVLDNPRIKSMFPDLSCVKIEVPDDEEDPVEDQYGILEPTQEPQEMQYQYEYSFETTTEDVSPPEYVQEGSQEEMDEDYIDEDTNYFYNNEIILGSKPTPNMEQLYEEALNSHPTVYLENWEVKLKSSPCFCNNCEILFPTVNALDAHKMISHSYLVAMDTSHRENTARKSTVTSKYCNHCSKTFPDDTSLIKHLYELLPLNNFPKVKEEKKEPEKSKLGVTLPFPKKIKSTSHVITKLHTKKIKIEPKEPTRKIKIEPKDVKIEKIEPVPKDEKQKYKTAFSRDGKFFAASSLVPKSTLFQCNVCQVGFLSCFSASQHSKSCPKVSLFTKCGICKRKIRTRDAKTHELQHSYNDKLKIYTMSKTLYERVLCKCPKCFACLGELAFWAHYPNCKKSDKKSAYCPDCDINIALCWYKNHRLKHSAKKLTKKDFIVVEFYDQNNMSLANEDDDIKIMKRRERKRLYKMKYTYKKKGLPMNMTYEDIKVYYCEHCGCCQCRLNYKGHNDGLCKRTLAKKYCEKCGLCFTAKSIESHKNLHEKRSFSLKDISVISLTTGKIIDTPMADFYECRACFKNFLYRRAMHHHDCKTEKYITCKICSKKFNVQAYKIHKIFHSADKLMPELMKKYQLINNMWNIMYMCITCELVTMTYDSAVTHSQGHLNYVISDLTKQCLVCDLRIAEKEFSLHEKLHTNNESIERESFKILKYNYEDLFKKDWLKLFEDLPQINRMQILSKSIYRFTRSVKLHVEIKSSSNDTKYFCINCNTFVEGPNIRQHVKSKCLKSNKFVCNICHEVFKSLKQFLSHEGSHGNGPKRQTIVTFNNECDREFNNHLSLIESDQRKKSKDVPLSILRDLLLSENSAKATYKLYKCVKCETCITLKSSLSRHRCIFNTKRRFCEICQQYFCAKKTALHAEAHKKKPYINKDSFYIVYFNGGKTAKTATKKNVTPKKVVTPKISPKKVVTPKMSPKKEVTPKLSPKKVVIAKIFKCQCGLHFTSMKTVEKHLDQCSPKLEVSKETCSKCKLVFPTDVLVTHLVNHHHKETKILIQKIARTNLFKCPQCSIYFTSMQNYDLHTEKCDPRNGYLCKNCGLRYGRKCYQKHKCSNNDITYINKVTVIRKKVVKEAVVYRCVPCDVTFLVKKTYRYHAIETNHTLRKLPTICKVCGLKFTTCAYRRHMYLHSFPNEGYKIKVVDPVSGDFDILTGNNRDKNAGNTLGDNNMDENAGNTLDIGVGNTGLKRKTDISEESPAVKKMKTRLSDLDTPLSERKKFGKYLDMPSTSKSSKKDLDYTPSEIIVPDEISTPSNTTDNTSTVNYNENDTIVSDGINDSVDKNGLSNRLKSRILVRTYGKILYKCGHCGVHYMKKESFVYHKNKKPGPHSMISDRFKCDICDIEFSKCTLPRHKYVHHDKMGLKRGDFEILVDLEVENNSEILDNTAIQNDSDTKILNNVNLSENSDTEKLSDVNLSETCNANSENENICENDKICYYKCSDCNVCFIDQTMCFEHTLKHEILDPKTYIQCKICDFQFLIDSLKEHMVLHHATDFLIERLTIHEYKSLGIGLDPKVDIYQAVDKVQSRLVSTTTDVGVI